MRSWRGIANLGVLMLAGCSGTGDMSPSREARDSKAVGQGSSNASAPRAIWVFYDSSATSGKEVARAITRAGGRVRYQSRWLHAISAELAPRAVRLIPHVTLVQPVRAMVSMARTHHGTPVLGPGGPFGYQPDHNRAGLRRPAPAACPAPPATVRPAPTDSADYGPNFGALRELGVPQAHALGFTGRGVRIAIIDTGFDTDHNAFAGACIFAQRDLINGDTNVGNEAGDPTMARDQEIHGTWVWSILGGYQLGQLVGPAYNAEFVLFKVDAEPLLPAESIDEDRWVRAVEWAGDSARADIINSSVGYRDFRDRSDYTTEQLNGRTTVATKVAAEAVRRGILVVTAVGNTSTLATRGSMFAPADADSVLAVGAIDSLRQVWPFSARGPTGAERLKPELVARGVDLTAALASSTYRPDLEGTSLAAPFVSGVAALFMEAWPEYTAMDVRTALILTGSNPNPDSTDARGYGVPNVASAIAFPKGITLKPELLERDPTFALTSMTPTFTWSSDPVHATVRARYRFELATDPQFNTVIFRDSTADTTMTFTRRPLRPITAFWWRVIARDSARPAVDRTSATSGPFSVPHWVTLTPQPEFVNTTHPEFAWVPKIATPPVSLEYDLQIISHTTNQVVQTIANLKDARAEARQSLTANSSYRWRVIVRALGVTPVLADTVESIRHFVVNSSDNPPTTSLYPSFPNPFPRNGVNVTRFWFDLAREVNVELTIHDLRGRLVRRLIPATSGCRPSLPAGQYGRGDEPADPCRLMAWDGRNQNGQQAPRGVYIARLLAGGTVSTQRILYLPER
jgi:subtilase family protein